MAMVFTDANEPGNPIIFANDAFLSLTGYDRKEVLGQSFNFLMARGADPVALAQVEAAFEGGDSGSDLRYRRKNGICEPLTAPLHATLVGEGDRWECDWGFRKVGSRCEEITPPPHAYLDASGGDWVCYPGFERVTDQCAPAPAPVPSAEPVPSTEPVPGGTPGTEAELKSVTPDPQGK